MQIVIDISKKDYEDILNGETKASALNWSTFNAIRDGIPLPKGHGRIIDESQITGTFTWDNGFIECFASTIIKADKAESEG